MNLFLALSCTYEPPGGGRQAVCSPSAAFDGDLGRRMGLSSHLEWGEASEARDFELAGWEDLGVGVVRRDLTWSVLEPARGQWDFAPADRAVEAMESAGVEPLGLLDYGNSWASEDGEGMGPPDDLADFGAYATAVAQRYEGRIHSYEVWNEPNAGLAFWKPEEDPAAYGALLVVAADAIHAVDPEAEVIFAGVFHPDLGLNTPGEEFIAAVHEAVPDFAEHIDAMAFHPYRYPFTAPEDDEFQRTLEQELCDLRDLNAEVGAGEMPLHITELGWHTAIDALTRGATQEQQASYLVRSSVIAFAHGVESFHWYTFRDSGDDDANQEHAFGLYGWDEDPTTAPEPEAKAAAVAYTVLVRMLGGHDTVVDLAELLGTEAHVYELSGGAGRTLVFWDPSGETEVLVPGRGTASLISMLGEESELRARGGAFTVQAGNSPSYLELPE
ncbi:MAG TPA: hypothetical protein QGF58_03125 [Myxococcota bacterium]|nr:hypothetical protein [Myxococcota bacterium]